LVWFVCKEKRREQRRRLFDRYNHSRRRPFF
jgi:hypothetical protein